MIVSQTSPVLLRMFLASIFAYVDVRVKQGQLYCDRLCDSGPLYPGQVRGEGGREGLGGRVGGRQGKLMWTGEMLLLLLFVWNTLTVSLIFSTTILLRQDPLGVDVAGLEGMQ